MGAWYGFTKEVTAQPTIDDDAYSAGDVVGGLLTFDMTSPTSSGGRSGVIRKVVAVDEDDVTAALTLYLFNAAPTTIADDAAFEPSLADLQQKLIGVVDLAEVDWVTVSDGTDDHAYQVDTGLELDFNTENGKLYGYLVCTATPTYTNTDALFIRLSAWID